MSKVNTWFLIYTGPKNYFEHYCVIKFKSSSESYFLELVMVRKLKPKQFRFGFFFFSSIQRNDFLIDLDRSNSLVIVLSAN